MGSSDDRLGMKAPVTRRDVVRGMAVAAGGWTLAPWLGCADARPVPGAPAAAPYPPAWTGLRGSVDGTWEVAHALRDGRSFARTTPAEAYDLVVVGAGISGLAAAWFFRREHPGARVLLLDNHDDFGGHARRIELDGGARSGALVGYGGSQSIESPSAWSAVARELLRELGIDVRRFYEAFDQGFYSRLGMTAGDFLCAEAFGADALLARGDRETDAHLARFPLPAADRESLLAIFEGARGRERGEPLGDAWAERLRALSYADYLTRHAGATPAALRYLADLSRDEWGIGADGLSASCAFEGRLPGFGGLAPAETAGGEPEEEEPYIFHFPDGNASIARALVRALMPHVAPGDTMEDLVRSPFDYGRLDEAGADVRLRLSSTVVDVASVAGGVEITFVREGAATTVGARGCVLACWHGVIPHLCREVPAAQREALAWCVKVPLVYAHASLRDFEPWRRAGIHEAYCPGAYFSHVALDYPVSLGDYRFARSPRDPVMVHMVRAPAPAGPPAREQLRLGRHELLATPFERFEREMRAQLARMLGAHGFDPAADLLSITVSRWPHGYAYEYEYAGEPPWADADRPCVVARRPLSPRIAIANSDSAGRAYADAAIDEAHRAVAELDI